VDGGRMSATLEDLKYEYEKAMRVKSSLEKNYERRKKLNLLDDNSEYDLKKDIEQVTYQVEDLKKRVRALESQHTRSRVIAESDKLAPWDN
jgi:polyhydroxyalkanoate synthesis regulator phasin